MLYSELKLAIPLFSVIKLRGQDALEPIVLKQEYELKIKRVLFLKVEGVSSNNNGTVIVMVVVALLVGVMIVVVAVVAIVVVIVLVK
jgi:hypothetical protein